MAAYSPLHLAGTMLRMLLAMLGYCALAVALTWPLARDLRGQLPGDPAGDTGVYVWNLWVVDHELREGKSPLHTERIFAATGTADLSQHNMTLAPAVVASPLVGRLGVVTTFNLVYLGLLAGCGLGVFLLSRYLTGRSLESWLAGALTAASPCVLARSTEHLSLLALGVVPLFAYTWVRMLDGRSIGFAVAAGVAVATAAYCDPYLAIYCTLLAAFLLSVQVARVTFERRPFFGFGGDRRRILDAVVVALALIGVSILVTGGWTVTVMGGPLVAHTLYTPVLAITVLGALRLTWWTRPRVSLKGDVALRPYLRLGALSAVTGALCLAPWLFALMHRMQSGRMATPTIYWRSSPPGVDLAAFYSSPRVPRIRCGAPRSWNGSSGCIPPASPSTPRRCR